MKKKILYGIIIFVIIVLVINAGVVVVSLLSKVGKKEETVSTKQENKVVTSMICTYTDPEDFHYTIELTLDQKQLISRYDEMSWNNKDNDTCTFYKKRVEVYSSISGIRDEVDCDSVNGIRRTYYTFSQLDEKEANISELKYIREDDQTFDIDSYKAYREKKGYVCKLG